MASGGPAGDPQVTVDLKLQTGTLNWPLEESVWNDALAEGRGRGPVRHLKTLANRLGWTPQAGTVMGSTSPGMKPTTNSNGILRRCC
eukprot:4358249-Amphidinium_carterae.1